MTTTKTTKTYRMKIKVRVNGRDDIFVTEDVRATNAWDAEAAGVARVKRDHPDAFAIYAVSKRRV